MSSYAAFLDPIRCPTCGQSHSDESAQELRARLASAGSDADLVRRLRAVAADARRYRWLRDVGDDTWHPLAFQPQHNAEMIDKWIDAAMGAKP